MVGRCSKVSLLPGCGSASLFGSAMFTCKKNRLWFLHLCTKSWYKQLVPGLLLSRSSFDQFLLELSHSLEGGCVPRQRDELLKTWLVPSFCTPPCFIKKHLRLIRNKMNGRLPGGLQLLQGQLTRRHLKVCIYKRNYPVDNSAKTIFPLLL